MKLAVVCVFCMIGFAQVQAANFTSIQSGDWDDGDTWGHDGKAIGVDYPGPTDNVIIATGTTVQVTSDESVNDITISSSAILTVKNNKILSIAGNYVLNGAHTGGTGATSNFSGVSKTLSGLGVLDIPGGVSISTDRTILAGSNLIIAADCYLLNTVTITNLGTITVISPALIQAAAPGPTWINDVNSTFNTGSGLIVLPNIVLEASAIGNTVNYYQSTFQDITLPNNNTYYNLHLTGSGVKTVLEDMTVLGDLKIGAATLETSTNTITLHGDWTNEGALAGNGTVKFSGGNIQTITNPSGELFYNLISAKSSAWIKLASDITVMNRLTLTSGQIDANSHTLSIGMNVAMPGLLTYTGGFVHNGKIKRWVTATGVATLFPIGVSYANYYAPITTTFNALTPGALIVELTLIPGATNNGLPLVDNGTTVYNTFGTGYYTLTPSNGLISNDYNVEAAGLPFFNYYASTRILARANKTSPWIANGTHQPGIAGTGPAKRTNLTMLPVELVLADTVNCTIPATSPFVGSRNVCINSEEIYSIPSTGNTFTWFVEGGAQTNGGNNNTIKVKWGTVGTKGLLIAIEQGVCGSGLPYYDSIAIAPTKVTSIAGKDYASENTTIGNEETYSIPPQAGYTYAWSISGGTIITGDGTPSVTVRWGAAGEGEISVGITNSCGTATTIKPVHIYIVINSVASGSWTSPSTWDCNCVPAPYNSVRVRNPHTVTLPNTDISVINLIVDIGGSINNTNNKTFTVTKDLHMDGSYTGSEDLILDGFGSIDGIGNISTSGNLVLKGGDKTILSYCVLSIPNGDVTIDNNVNVKNNGIITINNNIVGISTTSKWINEAYAFLGIGGEFLTIGTAVVNAVGNTVEYIGIASQNIRLSNYYHLASSGVGARVMPATGIVGIAGDFTPGTNAYTITGSTVDFNGTEQIIGAFTFNNLTMSGGGIKTLAGSITHDAVLTLTSGFIQTESYLVTTPSTASVTRTNGYIQGNYKKWIITTSTEILPIGTPAAYTPVDVTFSSITTPGYITAAVISGDHPDLASTCFDPLKSVNAHYLLENNSLTAGAATLAFHYTSTVIDVGAIPSNFSVQSYTAGVWSASHVLSGLPSSTLTTISGVTAYGAFQIGENTCTYTWTGATSNLWNVAANWSTGNIPTGANDVVIPATVVSGNMPEIAAASASKALNNAGAIIIKGTGVLSVYGNVSNTGTITADSASTINMLGSSAQTITGLPSVHNLGINNSAGVNVSTALTVSGALSLVNGVLKTNNLLTLDFDAGGNIAYNASDAGTVTDSVQAIRNMSDRAHYISVPFEGITSGQINESTPIRSTSGSWLMATKKYDTQGWTNITDYTTVLAPVSGYSLTLFYPALVNMTGLYTHGATYSSGDYDNKIPPTITNGMYFMFGNPYPSTLDWETAAGWTKTNINDALYYWNPANNSVASYVSGVGTNGATQFIPAMQAFLVQVPGGGGLSSLAVRNNARVLNNMSFYKSTSNELLRLIVKNTADASTDETVIRRDDLFTADFEADVDASKLAGGLALYTKTLTGTEEYSINTLPITAPELLLPLNLKVSVAGSYTIECKEYSIPGYSLTLEDKLTATNTELTSAATYTISASPGDNVDRFVLHFVATISGLVSGKSVDMQISTYDNQMMLQTAGIQTGNATINVYDATGLQVMKLNNQSITPGIQTIALPGLSQGVYIVKVEIGDTTYVGKVVIK